MENNLKQRLKRVPESQSLEGNDAQVYLSMVNDPIHRQHIDIPFVEEALGFHRDGGKVLDVGCGPGQVLRMMARRRDTIQGYGIDLSESMVEIAYQDLPEELRDRVTYQVADATNIPYETGSFDFTICHFMAEHLPSQEAAVKMFKEINRVTNSKGRMFLVDVVRPKTEEEVAVYLANTPYSNENKLRNYEDSIRAAFSPEEWNEIVKKSGVEFSDDPMLIFSVDVGKRSFNGLDRYQYLRRESFELGK